MPLRDRGKTVIDITATTTAITVHHHPITTKTARRACDKASLLERQATVFKPTKVSLQEAKTTAAE
jgi:hypothetical protein